MSVAHHSIVVPCKAHGRAPHVLANPPDQYISFLVHQLLIARPGDPYEHADWQQSRRVQVGIYSGIVGGDHASEPVLQCTLSLAVGPGLAPIRSRGFDVSVVLP